LKDTTNPFENESIIPNDIRRKKFRSELEIWEMSIEPTENPKSECFGCTASMCSHDLCALDQYHWLEKNRINCFDEKFLN
jgi:hypothetical protein